MERYKRGDLTEAIVIAELKQRNVPVSIPFGDNERYDIIVEGARKKLYKVQIKTGRYVNGTIKFDGESQHTNTTGSTYESYAGQVDYFIVYSDRTETMYLVEEERVNTSMYLRIDDPDIDHPRINWARDFEFDRCWPPGTDTKPLNPDPELPPHRKGDATEAHVIAELLEREIPVTIPQTDNERFDLLAGTEDRKFHRLQIKTGWISEGCISFQTTSIHTNGQGTKYKPYDGDIDYFLVYVPPLDQIYLIEEDAFNTSISLRVEEPKIVNRNTRWAEDYEFDKRWPPDDDRPSPPRRLHPRDKHVQDTAIQALEEMDVRVSRALDPDAAYDLLAEAPDGGFLRLAVRTAQLKDGRVFFHAGDGPDDDLDAYLLFCHDVERVYAVGTDAFDSSITLWVREPKAVRRNTQWAAAYELAANWPPARVVSRRSPVGAGLAALRAVGAEVARVVDPDAASDLLVRLPDGRCRRVRVTAGAVWAGCIRLKPASTAGIDWFLVWCRERGRGYLVLADEFDASISLRVDPPAVDPGTINRAAEYELGARWPDVEAGVEG